jgi:hypothetical protein
MTSLLLDFAPAAWEEYQRQRAGELGARLRHALEQLTQDPEGVRADPGSRRYQVIEDGLQQAPEVWGMQVQAPDSTAWLVVWRELARVIEIGYIGPAPGTPVA